MENTEDHVNYRVCKECGQNLPITQFVCLNFKKGWYRAKCRRCVNKRIRNWWHGNPEWAKARAKRQYATRRGALLSPEMRPGINEHVRGRTVALREAVYVGYGGKCQCCGEKEPAFLTVDHVNNDGHLERDRGVGRRRGGQGA